MQGHTDALTQTTQAAAVREGVWVRLGSTASRHCAVRKLVCGLNSRILGHRTVGLVIFVLSLIGPDWLGVARQVSGQGQDGPLIHQIVGGPGIANSMMCAPPASQVAVIPFEHQQELYHQQRNTGRPYDCTNGTERNRFLGLGIMKRR
jgi:hypothetical protein